MKWSITRLIINSYDLYDFMFLVMVTLTAKGLQNFGGKYLQKCHLRWLRSCHSLFTAIERLIKAMTVVTIGSCLEWGMSRVWSWALHVARIYSTFPPFFFCHVFLSSIQDMLSYKCNIFDIVHRGLFVCLFSFVC